jgi:serine/threonine protein kinase
MNVELEVKRYRILLELGRNHQGGRVTYLAANGKGEQFAIKEFLFAQSPDWDAFKLFQREIDILKNLNHSRIPKYVEAFETQSGFCLVQQYIESQPLSILKPRSSEQIKRIAQQILEILCYLQGLHPPVLHRDLKPENLLEDEQGRIYLIDFGFARLGGFNLAASSVVVGTTGFMSPEQLLGRELTCASDLYSLGVTLVCLLTGIPSTQVNQYLNEQFQFRESVFLGIEPAFATWLQTLTQARVTDRFADALTALEAFQRLENNLFLRNETVPKRQNTYASSERIEKKSISAKVTSGLVDTEQFLAKSIPRWPKF